MIFNTVYNIWVIFWLQFFYFENVQNLALILHIDHRGKAVSFIHRLQRLLSFILKNLIKLKIFTTTPTLETLKNENFNKLRYWSMLIHTLSRRENNFLWEPQCDVDNVYLPTQPTHFIERAGHETVPFAVRVFQNCINFRHYYQIWWRHLKFSDATCWILPWVAT